jgi:CBS domain-containing protein
MVREHRQDEIPVVDDHRRPVGILDVQDLIALRLVSE